MGTFYSKYRRQEECRKEDRGSHYEPEEGLPDGRGPAVAKMLCYAMEALEAADFR